MSRYTYEIDGKTIIDYKRIHNDLVEIVSALDDAGFDEYGDKTGDKLLDAALTCVDESVKMY